MTQLGVEGGLVCTGNGTLGLLVQVGPDPRTKTYILSCSHVVARGGAFPQPFASIFDSELGVQQPAPEPCRRDVNRIGAITNAPVPFSVLKKGIATTTD